MTKTFGFFVVACAGAAASAQFAGVNGYQLNARVFNDFGTSTLNVNATNYPAPATAMLPLGTVTINEQFAPFTPGNFANKHVAWLSSDAGASRAASSVSESWSLNFCYNMTAPAGAPRKEGGIEIHQPRPSLGYTDEGQVLIASDGEVAVFGATMPFTGFGNNTYTLGTTAAVSFNYYAPGTVDPTKGAYRLIFTDAVTGVHDSGFKIWGTEPDGIVGFTGAFVGFKDQNQRNPLIADFVNVEYSCVVIPAPAGAALLGLAGLAMGRRRR